jgi:hypothetical protein
MLSLSQKESILRKRGVAIPHFPVSRLHRACLLDEHTVYSRQHLAEDLELQAAVNRWQAGIELLYEVHIRRPVETAIQTIKNSARVGVDATLQDCVSAGSLSTIHIQPDSMRPSP